MPAEVSAFSKISSDVLAVDFYVSVVVFFKQLTEYVNSLERTVKGVTKTNNRIKENLRG